jgi:hypothetical protein
MDTIIPDFVALCEADLNSRLRLSIMEDRATATISSEYAALPTGFLELRGIQLNTNPVASLSYMSPQDMDRIYGGTTGVPLFYAIVGNEFQFAPVPSSSYTAEIDYYVALDALASASTNAVLTKAPDLYLYGSLLHSAPYIQNDKRVEIWSALYEKAIKRIQIEDKVKIYSGNALVMRAG